MSGETRCMPAISLWQPWATLLAAGYKRVETRSWAPRELHMGETVAIHAAKHWTQDERELCEDDPFFRRFLTLAARRGLWDTGHPPLGCIVGVATFHTAAPTERLIRNPKLTEREHGFGNYSPGRYGWVFVDARPITPPVPLRGERGIFTWQAPYDVLPMGMQRAGSAARA